MILILEELSISLKKLVSNLDAKWFCEVLYTKILLYLTQAKNLS